MKKKYSPRMKNRYGIELDHLPERFYLRPLQTSAVSSEENVGRNLRYAVPIPENPKLIRFGALGPEFATNLDTILDEMGIHYLSISQKWLLRKQDHHFFERRLEDLASGEDRQALKWEHRFVQFWDAKPELLVSSDGRTKIFYDAAGITVDVNMGENYQELLHNAVREGELLLPKYLSYVDSRTKLEVLGFLIREIDDSIKMGLRPVPVNTIFYACSVPEDYEIKVDTTGFTLEKRVERREEDWKTTGLKTFDITTLEARFIPEWEFNGQTIKANVEFVKKQEHIPVRIQGMINWADLLEATGLRENEYIVPNIMHLEMQGPDRIALKKFPPGTSGREGGSYPQTSKRPFYINEVQLYMTSLGFSNHRLLKYSGKQIVVGEIPSGWSRKVDGDYLRVHDPEGQVAIQTKLIDYQNRGIPVYEATLFYHPEDQNVLEAYVKELKRKEKETDKKERSLLGRLKGFIENRRK